MTRLRWIARSARYHARSHLAVALGVAAATAVLTGALLVGDSMQGSLKHLALERLGPISRAIVGPQFFSEQSVRELAAGLREANSRFGDPIPAIVLETSLETADSTQPRRANHVQLFGVGPDWAACWGEPVPGPREIVLNRETADGLGVREGDSISVTLPASHATIPADTALGNKKETTESRRVKVTRIVPNRGSGAFSLRPSQQAARNAWLNLDWLRRQFDRDGMVNAVFLAGKGNDADLERLWKPSAADCGIHIEKTKQGYWNLTSDRMLLDPAAEKAILAQLHGQKTQPALTYLANAIAYEGLAIPYSTITAVDFETAAPLGPMIGQDGQPIDRLKDGQIVLNRWAANELGISPDLVEKKPKIVVSFFEPETTHGQTREKKVDFELAGVVELTGAAADRNWTPAVPGVTDKSTMGDWTAPFPFDSKRLRPQDHRYWDEYRATPKAFVSLTRGRELWASRFGDTTSIRVAPREELTAADWNRRLTIPPNAVGIAFQPVRRLAEEAAVGATPFNVLFLAFSSFLIAAALMLVSLLFSLGIESRARELGILLALGYSRRRTAKLLAAEGYCVAALGGLLGVCGGIGYAAMMVAGLRTWWVGAISAPFVQLYLTPGSLALGFLGGWITAAVTIVWTVRRAAKCPPRELLAGHVVSERHARAARWDLVQRRIELALVVLILAAMIVLALVPIGDDYRAGAFFGTGSLALATVVFAIRRRLRAADTGPAVAVGKGNLARLAVRNACRNPGRSALSIGLVGSATFLIVAVSAFRIEPERRTPDKSSGDGGFSLIAQTDRPVFRDLNSDLASVGGSAFAFRVQTGEDASCLNLYQARQPRVLGAEPDFIQHDGFAWAGSDSKTPEETKNPWLLLDRDLPPGEDGTPRIPVILEQNTAMYALHLWRGVGAVYDLPDGHDGTIRLQVVGLLANSVFQGDLLIGERQFLKLFPDASGHRYFLIEAAPQTRDQARATIEQTLAADGVEVQTTAARLAALAVVQNTYLSAFQSLGSLGLLLGTFGLAAVQLRNVLERRGELALLRAVGFARRRLAECVLLENASLLIGGLGAGILASLVAVFPHLIFGGATIPWASLAASLGLVLAAGLLASLAAVRAVLRAPLLLSLREESA